MGNINLLDNWESHWNIAWPWHGREPKDWSHAAGLWPEIITEDGETFFRLKVDKDDEGDIKYKTCGMYTKKFNEPGKYTVVARFNGGNGTWPAIFTYSNNVEFMKHCYEVDLCEYFQKRPWCKTGYFCPASVTYWYYRLFRPKRHPFINPKKWNKFELEWDEKGFIVKVNDKKVIKCKNKGDKRFYPQEDFFLNWRLVLCMQYNKKGLLPIKLKQLPLWMDIKEATYEPAKNLKEGK